MVRREAEESRDGGDYLERASVTDALVGQVRFNAKRESKNVFELEILEKVTAHDIEKANLRLKHFKLKIDENFLDRGEEAKITVRKLD